MSSWSTLTDTFCQNYEYKIQPTVHFKALNFETLHNELVPTCKWNLKNIRVPANIEPFKNKVPFQTTLNCYLISLYNE